MRFMSEISDTPTSRTATAVAPPPPAEQHHHEHRTPKVFKAAAWVAIVAGIVFIVSVIFFTGFRLGLMSGHHGGGHHRHHKHHPAMYHHTGFPQGGAPQVAPGAGGPGQVPPSVAPSLLPSATPAPTPGR